MESSLFDSLPVYLTRRTTLLDRRGSETGRPVAGVAYIRQRLGEGYTRQGGYGAADSDWRVAGPGRDSTFKFFFSQVYF